MRKLLLLMLLLFLATPVFAQLGFCEGSKGDPIFHEDFGTGNSSGPQLETGITSYSYVTGDPSDGQYTISSQVGQNNTSWHPQFPPTSLSKGKALVVNASFTSGQFYRTEINGLCQSTTYEFSAFLMNVYNRNSGVCENGGIPINVRFEIWDETETTLLKGGSTGDITSSSSAKWEQYALTFQSEAGQESVILKMFNNGVGGCGNDLAIDDIIFRSCGDLTEVADTNTNSGHLQLCGEETPASLNLQAISDSSVYSEQYYQWQQSTDNSTWQDITGATGDTYSPPGITSSTYFRVKVAEAPSNLLNNLCSSASEAFYIEVIQTPLAPVSLGNVDLCSNESHPGLRVQTEVDETIDWYDAPVGGNLLAENTHPFYPEEPGTYYAEAHKTGASCNPGPRTAIIFSIFQAPVVEDEMRYLCADSSITLDAEVSSMSYSWDTGATSKTITVSVPGIYKVRISTPEGCSTIKTIEVKPVSVPIITEILSEGPKVEIVLENSGDFEYSLDGSNFQQSSSFPSQRGGIYTAYVRNKDGCTIVTKEFAHLVLPQFISPNNDGYQDYFELRGVSFFGASEIKIFNRYGKLLFAGSGANFRWNGKLGTTPLPADDYWYLITIEGMEPIRGHFSLIR